MTAGVFSYASEQSVLIHSKNTISFTIYTLQFAAKSATYRYGIYADVKSESEVFRIPKKQRFRVYADVKLRFVQTFPNSEK